MNTKVIYFRAKSGAGSFSATDGEIESSSNIRLVSSETAMLPSPPSDNSNSSHVDSVPLKSNSCPNTDEEGNTSTYESPISIPTDPLRIINNLSACLLPIVEFSLTPAIVPGWHAHPDAYPSIKIDAPKTKDTDGWRQKASDALNKFLKTAAAEHLFVCPFLALSALRLKDGSHILPSSPVLLLPNTTSPHLEGPDNLSADSLTLAIVTKISRLRCKITVNEQLLALSDHIEALDIFISSPLPLYDNSEPLLASHRASNSSAPLNWLTAPLTDSEFTANLLSAESFRMISSIDLSLITTYDSFKDIIFNVPGLSDVAEVAKYKPDFLQHHAIAAATGCTFSGRITLADLTLTLPTPPPAAGLSPVDLQPDESSLSHAAVEVTSVKNGLTLHSSAFNPIHPAVYLSDTHLPQWIFIPDPDARKLTLITSAAGYVFPLKRHPRLNGAFYWCGSYQGSGLADSSGVKKLAVSIPSPEPDAYLHRDSFRLPDAIWRSSRSSSLHFPDRLLMNTGDNVRIIALCRAFRASGLVATTSPTAYLFTTRGIVLLKEMDDGSLRDAGLIANYVLGSPESIFTIGASLFFTTVDGIPMKISGTSVKAVAASSMSSGSHSGVMMISAENPLQPISVVTRPIKLAVSPGIDYKSVTNLTDISANLLSIELLGEFFPYLTTQPDSSASASDEPPIPFPLEIKLYGSRDLSEWQFIGCSKGRRTLRTVYAHRVRYLRLQLSGHLSGSIEAFSLQTP